MIKGLVENALHGVESPPRKALARQKTDAIADAIVNSNEFEKQSRICLDMCSWGSARTHVHPF